MLFDRKSGLAGFESSLTDRQIIRTATRVPNLGKQLASSAEKCDVNSKQASLSLLLLLLIAFSGGAKANAYLIADLYQDAARVLVDNPATRVGISRPPHYFAELEHFTLFDAEDSVHGWELWRTNGTAEGTYLVKDINPGRGSSNITAMTTWAGEAYMIAYSNNGFDLWKSDGTPEGTVSLGGNLKFASRFDINRVKLLPFEAGILFSGNDETSRLWVYQKKSGFRPFTSIVSPWSFIYWPACAMGDEVILRGEGGLWRTDGTEAGTYPLEVALPDHPDRTAFVHRCGLDDDLYFTAQDPETFETVLGRLVGSDEAPELILDTVRESAKVALSLIEIVSQFQNALLVYFEEAELLEKGLALVNLDSGTTEILNLDMNSGYRPLEVLRLEQSAMVAQIRESFPPAAPIYLIDNSGNPSVIGEEIRFAAYQARLGEVGFFTGATQDQGNFLWRCTPGESQLTSLASGFRYGFADDAPWRAFAGSLFRAGDRIVFRDSTLPRYFSDLRSADTTDSSAEVFASTYSPVDGSDPRPIGGDRQISFAVAELGDGFRNVQVIGRDDPNSPVTVDPGRKPLFRTSEQAIKVDEDTWLVALSDRLWVTDGTPGGSREIWRPSRESSLHRGFRYWDPGGSTILVFEERVIGGTDFVLFSFRAEIEELEEFFRFPIGYTTRLQIAPTAVNGQFVFALPTSETGIELWKTDGTTEGTVLLKDINPGEESSWPTLFFAFAGQMCFVAAEKAGDWEIWCSDGTADGTSRLSDINPGDGRYGVRPLVQDGTLWVNRTTSSGEDDWFKFNGPDQFVEAAFFEGPDRLCTNTEIDPGAQLINLDLDTNRGREPYVVNCIAGTVRLAADVEPGPGGSDPASIVTVGELSFFSATRKDVGRELFYFDAKTGLAKLMSDIRAGEASSSPEWLLETNGELLLSADATGSNRELWGTAAIGVRARRFFCDGECTGWGLVLEPTSSTSQIIPVTYEIATESEEILTSGQVTLNELDGYQAFVPLPWSEVVRVSLSTSSDAFILTPTLTIDLRELMFTDSFEVN